ncbi:hypothetical protein BC940DRAFT_369115 [Gongronella butleri]|nr:hypothetical protein BC940DRAFT_369115 [Gongronella butleri]
MPLPPLVLYFPLGTTIFSLSPEYPYLFLWPCRGVMASSPSLKRIASRPCTTCTCFPCLCGYRSKLMLINCSRQRVKIARDSKGQTRARSDAI